jgi:aspartate ammonia-lyase
MKELRGPVIPTNPKLLPADRGSTRIEHDLLGDLAVPAGAYYGVQTARALDNFQGIVRLTEG